MVNEEQKVTLIEAMNKTRSYKSVLCCLAFAAVGQAQAQLLKGTLKANVKEVQVAYSLDGDVQNMVYKDIEPDKDGNFSFYIDGMSVPSCEVEIYTEKGCFGAYVEKDKTAIVQLFENEKGEVEASFSGDNKELSQFYSVFANAFDVMKYFSMNPENAKTTAEYQTLLDSEYKRVKEALTLVKDNERKSFYMKLAEGKYGWQRLRLIMDDAEKEGKKVTDYAEYSERIADINPNDSINVRTNLSIAWLSAQQKTPFDPEGDLTDYYLENLDIIQKEITNPAVKKSLLQYNAYAFFGFAAKNGDINKYWTRYQQAAKDYPELVFAYQTQVDALTKTQKGADLPYVPTLTRPDGTTCKLSDLYGKFLYLDIWATWCGPCCAEIPYLEKVAAHYKRNDKIAIISISVDQNQKAWLKKLETDKPEWAQYVLSKEENQKFMKAWGISGIPRFIMISKDGKIFAADAARPSDNNVMEILNSQL